ncbi:stretch-activated Ca2+-permeable channel component-domain-containing protein [Chaetomidium leptoderma]|uniref:Stretch-activated Ca2+-permeable channel component-domain-containing protein n=1 Tax=Chaetomidium leptoderma TaxID=669021 RepID=A0AAN7A014_9PEZI|nr:stretch-activated Ca2+-permeable channel component-domain-containing protein [Chaetomidium leptoderma]
MQLSPLQSRLAASLVASCLLMLLYLVLFPPNFALAAELKEALPVILNDLDYPIGLPARSLLDPTYEPEFSPFDRSIIGRAPAGVTSLINNEATPMNVDEGTTQRFVFVLPGVSTRGTEEGLLESRSDHIVAREQNAGAGAGAAEHEVAGEEEEQTLAKRQKSRTVYISANTCEQPQPIDPSKTTMDPPQLTLFVSTTAANQAPGPLADQGTQFMVVFNEGAAMFNFTTDKDVYIGVHAPNVSEVFSGTYNFRVAASVDSFYHNYNEQDDADLIWVDSDSQGALLITHNLTDNADPNVVAGIMNTQPYVLFAHNKHDRAINGLRYSFCGLQNYAQIAAIRDGRQTDLVRTGMTTRGLGNLPKQQFFFTGLNSSAEYIGILATNSGNGGTLGQRQIAGTRGTKVFKATNFSTKSDHGNCALVVDLSFCDQVAYSVPSNPSYGNSIQLGQFYDLYASTMYANFNRSLDQIACEAPSSQRYSLARNCTDCAAAYKDWLCSVAIPRCEDFSNAAPYLQPRAIGQPFPNGDVLDADALSRLPNTTTFNSSRNPLIDEVVKPGPYKELLPCDDLCYKLVQSCPAALGFGCPLPGGTGFKGNYARHDPAGGLTCNFPGSAHVRSAGGRASVVNWGLMVAGVVVGIMGLMVVV